MVEALARTGQRDNTVVIFMSDHGEMLGDHGLTAKGCRFYVAPTLAELTGEPLAWTNGRSLLAILTGEADPVRHREHVRCEYYDATVAACDPEPGQIGRF